MNNHTKTKEELIIELELLKQENLEINQINETFQRRIMNCEAIFESSPVAMFIIDETTNILMVNLAAVKLCDGSEEEILQHRPGNALRCVHSVEDPRGCGYAHNCKTCDVRKGIESLIANGGTISGAELELVLNHGDGPQSVWMNVGIEPLMKDGQKNWCIAMSDITKSKLIEESLRISEERFRGIFNNLQDAYFQADLSGNFTMVSPSALRMYGYDSLEELIGMPASTLYADNSVRDQMLKELQLKGEITDFVGEGKRKDGSTFWASMNIRLLQQDGKVSGTEGIVRDISDRKQTEQRLFESQAQLKSIIDSTTDMIWSVDIVNFGLLTYNQAFVDYYNTRLNIQVVKGMRPKELLPNADLVDFWYKIYLRGLKGVSFEEEYQMTTAKRTLKLSINPIRHGEILAGLSVFAKDVTAQTTAEEALIRKEEEYRTLVENLSVGIVVHDASSAIIFSNLTANQILGLTDDQLKGRSAIDTNWGFLKEDFSVMPVEDYPANIILATGTPLKNYLVGVLRPDLHDLIWAICNGYPVLDSKGKIINIVITFADITNRKIAEEELIRVKEKIEESEFRLKLATSSAGIGIWDWNLETDKMIWDDRMFELYGITPNTFPNNIDAWTNGLHPEDKQMALNDCTAAINGEREFNTSFRVLHPDGTVLYLKAIGSVLRDKNDSPVRMIGINRDITDNRLAAKQLMIEKEKAEESDRLKSAFLANMSHEIRTPLNSIIGFSDLLLDPDFEPEQKMEFATLIRNSGNNLLAIINDIMDISKIETGQLTINTTHFLLEDIIKEIVEENSLKAIEKGIDLRKRFADQGTSIKAQSDPNRLKQILTNLVNNAIKFTEQGYVEIGFSETNDAVQIQVKDTGIGIPQQYHNQIFDRFRQIEGAHTRKYGGNGLGLTISKNLVDLLGGNIGVISNPDDALGERGTTFWVSIPKK